MQAVSPRASDLPVLDYTSATDLIMERTLHMVPGGAGNTRCKTLLALAQVIAATSDGKEFDSSDAQLQLDQGTPR